jgi:hypothetical protein
MKQKIIVTIIVTGFIIQMRAKCFNLPLLILFLKISLMEKVILISQKKWIKRAMDVKF